MTTIATPGFGIQRGEPAWLTRLRVADRHIGVVVALVLVPVNWPLLALLTLGMGWHNNHHRYAAPARAGFAWYEVDPVYYILRLMQACRLIRDMKSALPADVRRDGGLPA